MVKVKKSERHSERVSFNFSFERAFDFVKSNKFHFVIFFLSLPLYFRTILFEIPYNVEPAILTMANSLVSGTTANIFTIIFAPNNFDIAPLLYLLYVGEVYLFGPNPYILHFSAILIFSVTCTLVFDFLKRFVSKWVAVFSTCLFIVHPFMVEVVSGIEGSGVLLSLILFILSFNFFFFYKVKHNLLWSCLCFYSSLLFSFYGMFLPFIMLFYGYNFTEEFKVKKVLPLLSVLLVFIGYTFMSGAYPFSSEFVITGVTSFEYIMTSLSASCFYIGSFFLPLELSSFYGVNIIKDPLSMDFIFSLQIIALLIFACFVSYSKDSRICLALILVLCSLVPISHILPQPYFISSLMSVYIVFGFVLLIGRVIDLLIAKFSRVPLNVMVVVLIIPLVFCSYITIKRTTIWKDNVTLLEDSVVNFPDDYMLRYRLGLSYEKSGRVEDALFEYEKSVQLNMSYGMGYYYIGRTYARLGDFYTATKALKWAIANGVTDRSLFYEDPLLSELAKRDEFKEIEKILKEGIGH